jgi:hypothetical protein
MSYNSLNKEYSSLRLTYANLESRYNELAAQCVRLNETLTYVVDTTNSYSLAKEAMPKVLNNDAVRATASAVFSAGSPSRTSGALYRRYMNT